MTLVAGLGNPGNKYKNNRHNIGFMVIDALLYDLKPTNISKSIFKGDLYKTSNTLFLKPTTFMNDSGLSILAVANYYKISRLIVLHDDLELVFGSIRIKRGGGNAGHNGLKSIDLHFGKDYERVRLGIGRPESKNEVVRYVLSDFPKDSFSCLEKVINHAKKTTMFLLNHSIEETSANFTSKKSLCETGDRK